MRKATTASVGAIVNSGPPAHKGQLIRRLLAGLLPLFLGTGMLMLMVFPNVLVILGIVLGPNVGHWYAVRCSSEGAE